MENKNKVHEPLFHITKKEGMPMWQSLLIKLAAIALAIIICAVLASALFGKPVSAFLTSVFKDSLSSSRKVWKMLNDLAVLLCISLAITPAFRMKFWNIGAEGQVLIGALASTAVSFYLGEKVSEPVLLVLMFIASILAGAIWGVIPALFKAIWNTNETLFTLMMNYIATYLVSYFLIIWVPSGSSNIGELPNGHLPIIFNQKYLLVILAVAALTAFMYFYLKYSKHGYEISVVGESQKTACYIGINVKTVIIRTMIFSGAICGLAGYLIFAALDHTVNVNTVGGLGFTAIMVSWLAHFDPLYMIATSFLVVFLKIGGEQVSKSFDISEAFPNIFIGLVLFFIIGCEFFINYKLNFISRKKEDK